MSVKANFGKLGLVLALVAVTGCSDLTPREQRLLTGGAAGTTMGALTTTLTGGCIACGAAIGGVAGAGAGYIVDQMRPESGASYSSTSSRY